MIQNSFAEAEIQQPVVNPRKQEVRQQREELKEQIERLKKKKNAIILAHYYQVGDIQEVADFVGDSLGLSQQAAATDADIILFAGVHFMGETAKILSPNKKVLLPDMDAGCSLADSCPPDRFRAFCDAHPSHVVVTYINCSAEIKALSDIVCTSSNAERVVASIPKEQPIIFAPDIHLGSYIKKVSGREMLLWNGACMVHDNFSLNKIRRLKAQYPGAEVLAHPECSSAVLEQADYIGSTAALLNYSKRNAADTYIVVTEEGILHQMRKDSPQKTFIPAPLEEPTECACGECPYMKLNTLENLYRCLLDETPEIVVPENIRQKAIEPIRKMLALG